MDEEEVEDLFHRATSIDTANAYRVWKEKCDECLDFLRETCRSDKRRRTSAGVVNAAIARLARLEGLRNVLKMWALAMSNRKKEGDSRGWRSKQLLTIACLHYFYTSEKLSLHIVDCTTTNDCAVILPNENDKWLSFRDYNKKERLLFVVYTDLECILEKKKRINDENI
ncbi:hypothetical protein G5I_00412 [Acromyrmex echinatior]|uniref:Uncharacterized protein n=1 Tax=Acromyrmex echinatior TaxID=103372 RepID=F4W4T7_ACREC|nr:hypothetical protein G5I_00412 [Acromyrmex echinatior]